jgi:hypothetical protein
MRATDLIKIIDALKSSGCTHFKHGDLELKFSLGETRELGLGPEKTDPPSEKELEQASGEASIEDQARSIDEYLSTLAIEDPLQYEELVVQRELEFSGSTIDEEEAVNDRGA